MVLKRAISPVLDRRTNMFDDLVFLSLVVTLLAADSRVGRTVSVPSFILPFSACVQSRGEDGFYRGAIDVTESGHRCLNWTDVAGFEERYPGKGIGEHNYCRNPDGRIRPWCFFRNPRGRVDWGYCDCKQGRIYEGLQLIPTLICRLKVNVDILHYMALHVCSYVYLLIWLVFDILLLEDRKPIEDTAPSRLKGKHIWL